MHGHTYIKCESTVLLYTANRTYSIMQVKLSVIYCLLQCLHLATQIFIRHFNAYGHICITKVCGKWQVGGATLYWALLTLI